MHRAIRSPKNRIRQQRYNTSSTSRNNIGYGQQSRNIISMDDTQTSAFNQILVCLNADIMFENFLIFMGIDIDILRLQNGGQRGGANFNIMFLCFVSFMYSLIQVKAINPSFIQNFNTFKETNTELKNIINFVENIEHTNSFKNLGELIPTNGVNDRNQIISIGSKIVDTIDTFKILNNNQAFTFISLIKNIGSDIDSIIKREYKSSIGNNISFLKNICDLGLLSATALNKNLPFILETGSTAAGYANIFLSLKIIADINSDALGEYARFTHTEKINLLNRLYGGRSKRKNRRSKRKNRKSKSRSKSSTRYRM